MSELGVGIVGFGFMGRTHARAYRSAAEDGVANHLVAVCDRDPGRVLEEPDEESRGNMETGAERLIDAASTEVLSDPAALFAHEAIDVVSLCTPTDSHVPLAIAALEAGKHVLVEKPVALSASEVERLAAAARASDRVCMPAMCIRFWPGWSWLKGAVEDGTYGSVESAVFRRLASRPSWGAEFYRDSERTGGALFDLHVHDADLVRHLFGAPDSVESTGTLDHVTTLYRFADGPRHVVAEGGWDHAPGFPFHMGYTVVFERATATWSLDRDPPLVVIQEGEARGIEDLGPGTGYDGEVRHFLAAVRGEETLRATVEEAVELTRMLEAERASLDARTG